MTDAPLIPLAQYIIERFKQQGVKHLFGVPGDYQLELLDYFERDPEIEWVGNANELGAAYAADGYARVRNGMAVCVTTFGVGELSALGGIAGATAERLPVVHLVGSPRSPLQKADALVHHTMNLPGGQYSRFYKMSEQISAATVVLINEPEDALTDAVDRAIRTCVVEGRPVYLDVPLDYNHREMSAAPLATPLPKLGEPKDFAAIPRTLMLPPLDAVTAQVTDAIVAAFDKAKRPVILADLYAERYGLRKDVRALVKAANVRAFCTPTSKSLLDEQDPSFGGAYGGNMSVDACAAEFEAADFVLWVGAMKSDTNTGRFSMRIPAGSVELYVDNTKVGAAEYPGTDMRRIVPELVKRLGAVAKKDALKPLSEVSLATTTEAKGDAIISQDWLWSRFGAWLQDDDVVLGEMGTSAFGLVPIALPSNAQYHSQCMWGAIGWSVGAALGAAFAAREADPAKRTVLFVGDGSLQLTVQEIGTMVRRGLTPYIFVLNNDGYEIERIIHGPDMKYNDIANWDYTMMLPLFAGRTGVKHETHSVKTQGELQALLESKEFATPDRIRVIEVFVPKGDAPPALARILQRKI
jgi:pyruvate decarboxylase